MTFEQLHPDAPDTLEVRHRGWFLYRIPPPLPCCMCGAVTSWVALAFEASVCSEECLDRLDDEFVEAVGRLTPIEDAENDVISW